MVGTKVDFKHELREFYAARRSPMLVQVPEPAFLMNDGHGDPNTSREYREAVLALFSVSYAARFALKRVGDDVDVARVPFLSDRGVAVSEVQSYPWGRFCSFSDPDGNTWSVH